MRAWPNGLQTNAVVKVSVTGYDDIIVRMGEQNSSKKFCAIASIVVGDDNSLEVQKLVSFHNSHVDCNRYYSWGLNFTPGTKD